MDQVKTGKFIVDVRKEKGYTQKELAEILGISDKTISKWETGKGFPEVSLLLPLCHALDINASELLFGERLSDNDYERLSKEYMSERKMQREYKELKPVKNLFKCLFGVTLFIAVLEAVIALICKFFSAEAFEAMIINSVVWFGFSAVTAGKVFYDRQKLKERKQNGLQYEAKIVGMIPAAWVRVANYTTCKLECKFFQEDKEYIVKSSYCLLTAFAQKEDFRAIVYCDRENPNKCSVEIFHE